MSVSPIDQRAAAAQLLRIKKAGLSFQGFMDYYHPKMEWPAFMREYQEILDLLEKDALTSPGGNPIRRILVSMPPRHAKSFTGTINFPAYCMLRKPKREVMIGSYNNDQATTFGRATREIVTSAAVAKAFPKVQLSRETRAVDFWKTSEGGAYYSIGLGGTSTGRGANFLGIDDPYKNREEAESITMRRYVWNEWLATFQTRLQPDIDGQPEFVQITHTRWHPDDLIGRIMETPEFKRGEWLHLNFKALSVKEQGVYIRRSHLPADDPRYVPGQAIEIDGKETRLLTDGMTSRDRHVSAAEEVALWPARFPVDWLKAKRQAIGEREFSALYQQEPYVIGGNVLKEGWFQRYKPDELPEFAAIVLTADTAFKAKATNDYSVFTLGGVTAGGDIYVLRVWRQKLEFPELKRKAIGLHATYRGRGLRGLWIEDAASGQPLIQELKRDTAIPVMPWKPGAADKVARANSVTPLIEGGRVFIPEEADWLDDWMQEIVSFPNSKNDDQVDSLVILLDVLSRMVVTTQANWAEPISDMLKAPDFAGAGAFTSQPLAADPRGWQGQGGFANAQEAFDREWNGWGL